MKWRKLRKWKSGGGGGKKEKKRREEKVGGSKSHVMPHEKSMFANGRPLNG